MVDEYLPLALAGVAVTSTVVFAVGAALLSASYAGVWAGVTVGAFLFGTIAVVLLYAFGEMEREPRDRQERF